mmetsp:Transcript_13662/g.33029  ORF Transcript_13662/g.33029 Transcript_13662/m.33029 type:complete len:239 (-) Transcript_13662:786-1502(-)
MNMSQRVLMILLPVSSSTDSDTESKTSVVVCELSPPKKSPPDCPKSSEVEKLVEESSSENMGSSPNAVSLLLSLSVKVVSEANGSSPKVDEEVGSVVLVDPRVLLVSSPAASPKSADGESESTPEDATVACRSASMAASVEATISSGVASPRASPAAAPAAASPAPPAAASPPPPPPMPGMGMNGPAPLEGTRRAISPIIRSAGIPCSQTRPGPFSVATKSPSPPNMAFLTPFIISIS